MPFLSQKPLHAAAKQAHARRRPVERMPPSIKEEHRAAKKALQRRPVERMPPSIKVQHRAAKASKRMKINRKPTNREVFNLLMNNPYLNRVERDSMIKTHCGMMMPLQLTF